MTAYETAVVAHLGTASLSTVLLAALHRHDRRPYLRVVSVAWGTLAVALFVLLLRGHWGWGGRFVVAAHLALLAAHGTLLLVAASSYKTGRRPDVYRHGGAVAGVAVAVLFGANIATDERIAAAAGFLLLASLYFATATIFGGLLGPGLFGLPVTSTCLALLGIAYLGHAGAFARSVWTDVGTGAYRDAAHVGFLWLELAVVAGLAMAVLDGSHWALLTAQEQLGEAERKLKVMAETDPITGCFNRRVFRDLVDELRADRTKSGGVVVLLDIEDFRALNEREGQAAGDDVLRRAAHALRARTRTTDLLIRWGGDEFLLVLPGASYAEGEGRRAQVAAAVADTGTRASFGLAAYGPERDILEAVGDADRSRQAARSRG